MLFLLDPQTSSVPIFDFLPKAVFYGACYDSTDTVIYLVLLGFRHKNGFGFYSFYFLDLDLDWI